VADAHEAFGHDVQQEAAQKLGGGQGQFLVHGGIGVVVILEAYHAVGDGKQPLVGDGHAVGVARQIAHNLNWAAEWRLGVDHPLMPSRPS